MIPKAPTIAFILSFFTSAACNAANFITLESATEGSKIEVELLDLTGEIALIRRKDGRQFKTSLAKLSQASRQQILNAWEKRAKPIEAGLVKLNEAFGHTLISEKGSIWTDSVAAVAKRLKLPLESKTPYTSSYRLYPRSDYQVAGAYPKTLVAYGDQHENLVSISIIFSNKGDSFGATGSAEGHFYGLDQKIDRKTLEGAMDYDEAVISQTLTAALGEPVKQRMLGQGNKSHPVQRWDWNGHSFLLANVEEEYVGLSVVTSDFADSGGKAARISDGEMKERLSSCVVYEENGDVFIRDIPMVDQGPKGYCAPATFERAMRHAGVSADMYLLATLATVAGSGTNTTELYNEVAFTTRSKGGRTARQISLKSLAPGKLKRYIQKGVPILWQMCSLPKYNSIANSRSKDRDQVKDWEAYAGKIAKEANANVGSLTAKGYYHICMIIGYNEKTNEIAVSDSWGKRYVIRWIHVDEAEAVSNHSGFVIDI